MSKTLVGNVKNKRFAYFWLLIGGSLGNLLLLFYSLNAWPLFLPATILSALITLTVADRLERPRIWLLIDLLLACSLLILYVPAFGTPFKELTASLPSALIILGCLLGVMRW